MWEFLLLLCFSPELVWLLFLLLLFCKRLLRNLAAVLASSSSGNLFSAGVETGTEAFLWLVLSLLFKIASVFLMLTNRWVCNNCDSNLIALSVRLGCCICLLVPFEIESTILTQKDKLTIVHLKICFVDCWEKLHTSHRQEITVIDIP